VDPLVQDIVTQTAAALATAAVVAVLAFGRARLMAIRAAHGRARELGAVSVVETRPLDEIPTPNAAETAANLTARRVRGRPFERGNRAAVGRKPAISVFGVRVEASDPAYARALRHAARYRRRRCSELAAAYGGHLSAGASSLVASAALALAGSRYLYELAGRNDDAGLLTQAARLADSAKGLEVAAMDIAEREKADRPTESDIDRARREIEGEP
jgi:hypothetical protein